MSFFRNWFYMYLKQTAGETAFEKRITLLGKPYRIQYPFPGLRRIVDFALPHDKILIEIDGASHEAPAQRRKDLVTSIAFEKMGWKVIRFTNAEVLRIEPLKDVVEAAIVDRTRHRPTLAELEAALLELPELPEKPAKPRGRKRAPGPKKARKPRKLKADSTSSGSTE